MANNTVVVLNQNNYQFNNIKTKLYEILEIIYDVNKFSNKTILIKPNCGAIAKPEEGLTVHPIVLKALINVLKEYNAKEIIIAESSYIENDTIRAMEQSGLMQIIKEENVKFIDLKKENYYDVELNGLTLKNLKLPEILQHIDLIISLAKLKTNIATNVSLSIKNLKGLLQDTFKRKFHLLNLANCIYDLYNSIKVEKIGIIDGIIGSELYLPKLGNILAGGNDLISLDISCAKLMGFKKKSIKYLNLFKKPKYKVITDVKSIPKFNKKPSNLEKIEKEYNVEIIGRSMCSNCISPLINGLKKAKNRSLLKKKYYIIIGPQRKKISEISDNMIIIGNCLKHLENQGHFISGCPPISEEFVNAIIQINNK